MEQKIAKRGTTVLEEGSFKKFSQWVWGAESDHDYHSLGISVCAQWQNHLGELDIWISGNHYILQIFIEYLLCSMYSLFFLNLYKQLRIMGLYIT